MGSIEFAQAYGAQWIETSNEENNPMLQLNLRLGFQPAPAWLSFEKRLDDNQFEIRGVAAQTG